MDGFHDYKRLELNKVDEASYSLSISNQFFEKWRSCEMISAVCAVIGIVSATIDYERSYSEDRTFDNCAEVSHDNVFKMISVVTSVMSVFFSVLRHYKKALWEEHMQSSKKKLTNISFYGLEEAYKHKTKSRFGLLRCLELALHMICPYPYLNSDLHFQMNYGGHSISVCYTLTELLYFVMFSRLAFLLRALANYTPYEDHIARRFCKRYNVKANVRFSFKCMIKQYPLAIVLFFLAIPTFLLVGIFLRLFERPLDSLTDQDFGSFANSLWCGVVSMATIGYGDFAPVSYFGRAVVTIGTFCGAFIFSMTVLSLEKNVNLRQKQLKAFSSIVNTKASVEVIQSAFRLYLARKKGCSYPEWNYKYSKFMRKIKKFKEKRDYLYELHTYKEQDIIELKQTTLKIQKEVYSMRKDLDVHLNAFSHQVNKLLQKID